MFKRLVLATMTLLGLIALGTLASCNIKETIEDAFKQPYDANVDLRPEKLVPQKAAGADIPNIVACNSTSVDSELDKVGQLKSIKVTIDEVKLRGVQIRYKDASWTPVRIESVPCEVTISGEAGSAVISDFDIDGPSFDWDDVDVSPEAASLINHYLNHGGQTFSYCATCSGPEETFTAEIDLKIKVEVKGTVTFTL